VPTPSPARLQIQGRRFRCFRCFRCARVVLLLAGVLGATGACAQWSRAPVVRPRLLAVIPHDTAAFTQGLVWLDGKLYESTGLYGSSTLRELDPATGAVTRRQRLPARYFAEGLAWFGGEFIQLTWKEGEALRWPRSGWVSPASTRRLRYAGEGWGLAALGSALWMSNGSDTLYRRDGAFRITARVAVRRDGRPVMRLNELEAARGKIVANIWYEDTLVVIDPRDGRVLAVVDGTELAARSGRRSPDDVLNGVAWDPARDEFYVTGKNWPVMFRVKIPGF
jgi:glutamine cyclotransferase